MRSAAVIWKNNHKQQCADPASSCIVLGPHPKHSTSFSSGGTYFRAYIEQRGRRVEWCNAAVTVHASQQGQDLLLNWPHQPWRAAAGTTNAPWTSMATLRSPCCVRGPADASDGLTESEQ